MRHGGAEDGMGTMLMRSESQVPGVSQGTAAGQPLSKFMAITRGTHNKIDNEKKI